MQMASSASSTGSEFSSTCEYTTTVWMPSSRAARSTRRAISPRFAIRILRNTASVPEPQAGSMRKST